MRTHAAVGIDDDLASGESGVAVRSADLEAPGRVHIVGDVVAEQLRRYHPGRDFSYQRLQPFDIHVRRVLMRHHHRFDLLRAAVAVADRDLTLRVGPQKTVLFRLGLAQPRQFRDDLVRIEQGGGHQLRRFVRGVAEHHPLISGPLFLEEPLALGHALRDIRRLPMDGQQHLNIVGAEADAGLVVADVPDRIQRDLLPIDLGASGDFTRDHHQIGGAQRFTGDAAVGVLREAGVEDGVGYPVADLVGVSLGDRFAGEDVFASDFAHDSDFIKFQGTAR